MSMTRMYFLCAVVPLATLGCIEPIEESEVGTLEAAISSGDDGWGHGHNGPSLDMLEFYTLNTNGKPNEVGIKLEGATYNGAKIEFHVHGARMFGRYPGTANVIEASELASGETVLTLTRQKLKGAPEKTYEVFIEDHVSVPRWVDAGGFVDAYVFTYRVVGKEPGPRRALCNLIDSDDSDVIAPWVDKHAMIPFSGDHYDVKTKQITHTALDDGWFNLACAGSPQSKHALYGAPRALQLPSQPMSLKKSQTLLNSIVSKICPNVGTAFTVQNHRILIEDAAGHFLDFGVADTHEAEWDANGALCLDHHRLADEDPDILVSIAKACGGHLPPSCADGPYKGTIATHNPI